MISQGIIDDLMVVETVNIDENAVYEETVIEYKNILGEQKNEMIKDLGKIDEEYREAVAKCMGDYTTELSDGEKQTVANLKEITVTKISSLSKSHRADKKKRVQFFLNEMQVANRKLPLALREDAFAKVTNFSDPYFVIIKNDFEANLFSLKNFEDQEHLIVTEINSDVLDK